MPSEKPLEAVNAAMRAGDFSIWGVAPFDPAHLIRCSGLKRLPDGAQSVIVALLPYYAGRFDDANLSKYAMPADYHQVIGGMLDTVSRALKNALPEYAFVPFCDASPVPEVETARLAGLGVRGRNGLLIHPVYGSYVFIGEIVTDLKLPTCASPGGSCPGCEACVRACPAHALYEGKLERTRCLSSLTQRRGVLSPEEAALIRSGGSAWGCDICQDVCPLNRTAKITPVEAFRTRLFTRFRLREVESPDFSQKNEDRAFLWKGTEVLRRNLRIIENTPADTNGKSS